MKKNQIKKEEKKVSEKDKVLTPVKAKKVVAAKPVKTETKTTKPEVKKPKQPVKKKTIEEKSNLDSRRLFNMMQDNISKVMS